MPLHLSPNKSRSLKYQMFLLCRTVLTALFVIFFCEDDMFSVLLQHNAMSAIKMAERWMGARNQPIVNR